MKKSIMETIKIATASLLSIGLFSSAFYGVNNMALAAAVNTSVNLPPVALSANASSAAEAAPSYNYNQPDITVIESPEQHYKKSVNALTPEKAAEIGAQYIWDLFEEKIDGLYVEMSYSAFPFCTRAYWSGAVASSETELANHVAMFRFTLDAVTGERIGISNRDMPALTVVIDPGIESIASDGSNRDQVNTPGTNPGTSDQIEYQIDESLNEMLDKPDQYRIALKDLPDISAEIPENLDEFKQLASDYAQKHFNRSKVADTVFKSMSILPIARDKDRLTVIFKDKSFLFIVTDDAGREAEVVVSSETGRLLSIDTMANDIVPGYNADAPGGKG